MNSKDCSQINWDEIDYDWIRANWTWLLPQATALVAALPLARSSGLISPSKTVSAIKEVLPDLTWGNGRPVRGFTSLWRALLANPRGNIVGGVQTGTSRRYNSGVPLILAAWKESRGVLYEAWDWADPQIAHFVDEDVLNLVQSRDVVVDDDMLSLRETARVVKTGVKAGSVRSVISTIPFGNLGSEAFRGVSRLAKYCHTQTWIYHPSVRHPLQVYLPNLDEAPPPLVVDEVVVAKATKVRNPITTPFDDL